MSAWIFYCIGKLYCYDEKHMSSIFMEIFVFFSLFLLLNYFNNLREKGEFFFNCLIRILCIPPFQTCIVFYAFSLFIKFLKVN